MKGKMKYRYYVCMNSIYDQVYRNPFKVSDIKGLKVGAILVALKSMNLIRRIVGDGEKKWTITQEGENLLLKSRKKFEDI